MESARLMYLEQCCLLSELLAVATDQGGLADRDQGLLESVGPLHKRKEDAHASAAASLAKHLQAAALVSHMRVPSTQAQKNPFHTASGAADSSSSKTDTAGANADLIGSPGYIMGIAPRSLKQLHLPSRKAAQRAHEPLLPLLESQLKQHAQAAAAAVAGPAAGGHVPSSQVVQQVVAKQDELNQLQQSNTQQLQQLHAEAAAYLQELDSIHAVLQQLVGKCMLEAQPKLAQAQLEHTQATLDSYISKLHMMQLQLWSGTYSAKNVEALTVVRDEQQQMEQQLRGSIEQAEAQLQEYLQLGGDFQSVVQEYGDVLDKIQEVDSVLASLSAVEEAWSG